MYKKYLQAVIGVWCLVLLPNLSHAATVVTPFTFIAASDPQPWRLNGMPEDTGHSDSPSQQSSWRNILYPTYGSMSSLGASFVMINGDMTDFGRNTMWEDTQTAYAKANTPIYFGLGNHDYDNNFEDCANSPLLGRGYNECSMESIDNLEKSIIAKHGGRHFQRSARSLRMAVRGL